MAEFLCLADDLTGALEVGAKFALSGISSLVCTAAGAGRGSLGAHALVIDASTRHLAPEDAEGEVSRLARAHVGSGVRCVFKKTDSTLRGNIAAEFRGLMAACPGLPLFFVPAYPSLGRTVLDGRLYVEGVPVDRSSFGRDPFNPAAEASIAALLRELRVESLRAGEAPGTAPGTVYVFDAATEEDVRQAARFLAGLDHRTVLAAGTAALAQHVAELARLPRTQPEPAPRIRSCIVVNGSLHEQSHMQIRAALEAGWPRAEAEDVPDLISRCGWVVMEPPATRGLSAAGFAALLGETVAGVVSRSGPDAIVAFGGDTCRGVVDALGGPALHPITEVVRGVPVAKISTPDLAAAAGSAPRSLHLVAKAGGFGSPDVLLRIRERTRPA